MRPSDVELLSDLDRIVDLDAEVSDGASDADAVTTAGLRRTIADHMHDLVALALGCTQDASEVASRRGVRAARLRAIKGDIRDSLGTRDLSISALAKRHGVTPRYVQMLFEDDGSTFSEFVLGERLFRAYRLLVDARYDHLKVSEIAYRAGFSDLSYFNRTFRLRFGDTPRGARVARRDL